MRRRFFLSLNGIVVISVEPTDSISVSYNTPFFQVVFLLPITRQVTLSNGSVITSSINWQAGSFSSTTPDIYSITGTLTLPEGVFNPGEIEATVDVTVEEALTPDLLANQILWSREENDNTSTQVDNWYNKYNRSNDLIKITDARRPNINAAGIDGNPSYEFTRANNDVLRSEAALGLTDDFTIYVLFKCTNPTVAGVSQFILQNTDNGSAFVNTGIQLLVRENELWVDFRKNDAGDQQRIEFPFADAGWHLLTIKHNANGTDASTNVVKLDGAVILKLVGKDPVVHNSNLLKIGANSINANNPIGGSIAEIIMTADYHDDVTEASVLDYFKTTYPTTLAEVEFFDETKFTNIDSVSEAWNGLATISRPDGKHDVIGGTLSGKIFYLEQGATIDDWTTTLLVDTLREVQSLQVFDHDPSGRLIIITAHKDNAATDDNIGNLRIHRADTTNDKGAYSSVTLVTGRDYPQDIEVVDLDGDGEKEFIYSYEGTASGQGGIRWYKCSNLADVLTPGNWTEYIAKTHEGAWWIAGLYNIGGVDRLVFSARQSGRNPAEIPGLYYLTPASPVTNTWAETTLDNTAVDWLHVDVGNIYGNVNDIVAQHHDGDDIFAYDAGSSFAKSTIIVGGSSGVATNVKFVPGTTINGRGAFITFVEDDWAYLNYWNGSTWSRRKLFQTLGHPADNEIIGIDLDDSGFLTILFDDNTNLANANVRKFRL